jgi:ABC-2 type transport system ATP-binding protein
VTRVLGDGVVPMTDPVEVTARLRNPAQAAEILTLLIERRVDIDQFSLGNPSLDEVFLALTGKATEHSAVEATR